MIAPETVLEPGVEHAATGNLLDALRLKWAAEAHAARRDSEAAALLADVERAAEDELLAAFRLDGERAVAVVREEREEPQW